ncbi:transposase [Floridanema aerugineum]|uniref:Transposase n=1 Tax=Floridaenema aerugineum BLCC-F46 TaxID=3153654 RepID=A0ABV4XF23_9CYAN
MCTSGFYQSGTFKIFVRLYAAVVIDRFHVMKLVNQRLNKLRQIVGIKAKGTRFLLLKNSSDLTEESNQKLEQILAQSPCLRIAYCMKTALNYQIGNRDYAVSYCQNSYS